MWKPALCCAAIALGGTCAVFAQNANSSASLKVRVSLTDMHDNDISGPTAGQAFNIGVKLTDAVTGQTMTPDKGILSWIRPVDEAANTCNAAVQAYRATRRLSPDSVDLNGIVMADLTTEGTLLFVDPKLDLASSNILSAHQLREMPASVLAHPTQRTLYMSQRKLGRIINVGPFAKQYSIFASDLNLPGDLVPTPDGGFWVSEEGTGKLIKYDSSGGKLQERRFVAGDIKLRAAEDKIVAFSPNGGLEVFNGNTNQLQFKVPNETAVRDAVLSQTEKASVMLSLESDPRYVTVRFLDTPNNSTQIPIASPAERLAISDDGRWVIAYGPSVRGLSVIDIATGQLVQGLELEQPVSEVAFTDEDAFLRLADGSALVTLALKSLQRGKEADVGRVPLGAPSPDQAANPEGLLVALNGTNSVVAVHPETFAAFIVAGAKGTVNALPQTGVRLRGGIPRLLRVIDRSLIADRSAVYRTSALVPQSGTYELVIGTPLQGLASCIPFEVTGTTTRQKKAEVALLPADPAISIYAGKKSVIDFQLWDGNQPIQILAPLRVRFSSLAFGWRATANGHVSEKGITTEITLPLPGQYVVEVLDLPKNYVLRASPQIEVQP